MENELQDLQLEYIHQVVTRMYGFSFEKMRFDCEVLADGRATVTRTIELSAKTAINSIDTLLVSPPDALEAASNNVLSDDVRQFVQHEDVQCSTPGYSVNVRPIPEVRLNTYFAALEFVPSLQPNSCLKFKLTESTPKPVYRSATAFDANANVRDQYFGWAIRRPTKELELLVKFPFGYKPLRNDFVAVYAGVLGANFNSDPHQLETARIKASNTNEIRFNKDSRCDYLHLKVAYPMMGLTYMLRWAPFRKF